MEETERYFKNRIEVPTIEILGNFGRINEFNMTDKKITIKHYLNTYILPTEIDSENNKKYTLYFRAIFNRMAVKIKSNINASFSIEEFQSLPDDLIELLKREALHLTFFISEKYSGIEINLPTNKIEDLKKFDISRLFENYKYSDFEINNVLNRILVKLIIAEFDKNEEMKYSFILNQSSKLNPIELITFLKKQNDKWLEFEKKIHPDLWNFNFEYLNFISVNSNFHKLGATEIDLTYGQFSPLFNNQNDKTDRKSLINSILELIHKKQFYF